MKSTVGVRGRSPAGRRYHSARGFVNLEFRWSVRRLFASFFAVALSLVAGIAQLVEHNLAKVGVAGSSPVSRFVSSRAQCRTARWLVVLRSGGETGRREGLKIPWDKLPCGFDPRPEHSENDDSDLLVRCRTESKRSK